MVLLGMSGTSQRRPSSGANDGALDQTIFLLDFALSPIAIVYSSLRPLVEYDTSHLRKVVYPSHEIKLSKSISRLN